MLMPCLMQGASGLETAKHGNHSKNHNIAIAKRKLLIGNAVP
jgi:hypothetical protein